MRTLGKIILIAAGVLVNGCSNPGKVDTNLNAITNNYNNAITSAVQRRNEDCSSIENDFREKIKAYDEKTAEIAEQKKAKTIEMIKERKRIIGEYEDQLDDLWQSLDNNSLKRYAPKQ